MAHKYDTIPKHMKNDMKRIVYNLSPENLTCDGELSRSEVNTKINMLSQEWAILVANVRSACGVKVDYEDFEEYMY